MNDVTLQDLFKQIGEFGILNVNDFGTWLLRDNYQIVNNAKIRLATSIITRSEAELFNLSLPRFAYRLYLKNGYNSFINIRRLALFGDQSRSWSSRNSSYIRKDLNIIPYSLLNKYIAHFVSPILILRGNQCIADCLLEVPNYLKKYHIISTNLGRIYGEEYDVRGTPYIKHIELAGGGLCAQAVCFMATLLLNKYAKGIHGLAEITYLAQKVPKNEMIIKGLWPDEICNYFSNNQIGLNSVWQIPTYYKKSESVNIFSKILKSYLQSNFPVILTVDMGRLSGSNSYLNSIKFKDSIIYNNLYNNKYRLQLRDYYITNYINKPQNHSILLIGFNKTENNFIYHDPAILPYMIATGEQLSETRCYADQNMKELFNENQFLPITPERVRLQLGSWVSNDDMEDMRNGKQEVKFKIGLLYMASQIQGVYVPNGYPRNNYYIDPTDFYLIKPDLILSEKDEYSKTPVIFKSLLKNTIIYNYFYKIKNWCWLQYSNSCNFNGNNVESIWIWNAEEEGPDDNILNHNLIQKYLMGIFVKENGEWKEINAYKNKLINNKEYKLNLNELFTDYKINDNTNIKIRKALISSFEINGLTYALNIWPYDKTSNIDLYSFMQSDAEKYLNKLSMKYKLLWICKLVVYTLPSIMQNIKRQYNGQPSFGFSPPTLSARIRMASLNKNRNQIKWIASRLSNQCETSNLKIISLSSYVPGLATNNRLARRSSKAIMFLIKLANELKIKHAQPINIIEIVVGSLIDGVWPAKHKVYGGKIYVANINTQENAINMLIKNLKPIAEYIYNNSLEIKIVIDLEPGPLFVINSLDSLKLLCSKILEDKILYSTMRLNVAIAHWLLAGINKNELFQNIQNNKIDKLIDFVEHVHISGHSKGHLADLGIEKSDEPEKLNMWIKVLNNHFSEKDINNDSTRYVSLELEAVASKKIIDRSLSHKILHGIK